MWNPFYAFLCIVSLFILKISGIFVLYSLHMSLLMARSSTNCSRALVCIYLLKNVIKARPQHWKKTQNHTNTHHNEDFGDMFSPILLFRSVNLWSFCVSGLSMGHLASYCNHFMFLCDCFVSFCFWNIVQLKTWGSPLTLWASGPMPGIPIQESIHTMSGVNIESRSHV